MLETPRVQQIIPAADERWAQFAAWHRSAPDSGGPREPHATTRALRVQGWAVAEGQLYGVVVEGIEDSLAPGAIKLAEADPLFVAYTKQEHLLSGSTQIERGRTERLRGAARERLRATGTKPPAEPEYP